MTSQIKMATKFQFHMIYLDANSFCLRYDLLKMIFFTSITSINAEFKMACTLTIFVFKYNEIMQLFNWENHNDSVLHGFFQYLHRCLWTELFETWI